MRFAVATVALAGAAAAHSKAAESTVYSTDVITITSCAPTVTDCPARSTVTSSTVYPVTTSTIYSTNIKTITSCAATVTNCPAHSTVVVTETIAIDTTICPVTETAVPTSSKPYSNATVTYTYVKPTSTETYIETVSTKPVGSKTYVTTAIPLTSSAAVCVPSKSVKTVSSVYTSVYTSVSYETVDVPCATAPASTYTAPSNSSKATASTSYKPTSTIVTAGASSLAGSAVFAVIAGAVAVFLA